MAWFAIMSKPQREKAAVEALADFKVAAFTPMAKSWSRERIGSGRKRKLISVPMFRGYLFADVQSVPWQVLRACHETVRGVVSVGGKPIEIPAHQIEAVRSLEAEALPLDDTSPASPLVGQTVEIISGPFTGRLTRVDAVRLGHIVALVDTLGGKVRARIPADMVKVA